MQDKPIQELLLAMMCLLKLKKKIYTIYYQLTTVMDDTFSQRLQVYGAYGIIGYRIIYCLV